jgi:RND family efflux transporter MFP subunit
MRIARENIAWVLVLVLLCLLVVRGTGDDGPGAEAGEPGAAPDPGRIVGTSVIVDSAAARSMQIETAPAALGSITASLRVAGEVRLAEDRTAHVTPRIRGTIRTIAKNIGDALVQDEVLCTIDSTELGQAKASCSLAGAEAAIARRNVELWDELQSRLLGTQSAPFAPSGWVELDQAWADHLSAVSESGLAERLYTHWKELNAKGLKTTTELWTAESDALKARLRIESAARRLAVLGVVAGNALARASVQLDAAKGSLRAMGLDEAEIAEVAAGASGSRLDGRYSVRSPIPGFVLDRHATLGENVGPEDHAFLVGDLSVVWVQAFVHDRDVASVRVGMPAKVSVLGLPGAGFPGVIDLVGRIVDEKTRTLSVRVSVRSPAQELTLRPGMFATVDLETASRAGVLLVPVSAVVTVAGESVVFVRTPPAQSGAVDTTAYEKRVVETGLRNELSVEIVKGLAAGDAVVVTSTYLLKSEFERSRMEGD